MTVKKFRVSNINPTPGFEVSKLNSRRAFATFFFCERTAFEMRGIWLTKKVER